MSDILQPDSQIQLDALADAAQLVQGDDALHEGTRAEADPLAENTFDRFHQQFVAGMSAARRRDEEPDRLPMSTTALVGAGGLAAVLVVGYMLSQDAAPPVATTEPSPAPPQQNTQPQARPSSTAQPAPDAPAVERTPNRLQPIRNTPAPMRTAQFSPRMPLLDEAIAPPIKLPDAPRSPQPAPQASPQATEIAANPAPSRPSEPAPAASVSSSPTITPVQPAPLPTFTQPNIAPPEVSIAPPEATAAPADLPLPAPEPSAAAPVMPATPIADQTATDSLEFSQSVVISGYGVAAPETAPPQTADAIEPSSLLISSIDQAKTDGQGIEAMLNLWQTKPQSVLPLSNRAASEIAQIDQVNTFRVLRLSQSEYERVWNAAHANAAASPAPGSGFIDYPRQVIVLPAASQPAS